MATLLWTTTPFHTTVTLASSSFVPDALNRAARNVMSYVCQVLGAVAMFRSGARLR